MAFDLLCVIGSLCSFIFLYKHKEYVVMFIGLMLFLGFAYSFYCDLKAFIPRKKIINEK